MNLHDLLASAAPDGTVRLTSPGGDTATLTLDQAARLYGAAASDFDRNVYGSVGEKAGLLPVALQEVADGLPVLAVNKKWRFLIDDTDVFVLCTEEGCLQESLGLGSHLTRVCEDHLDVPELPCPEQTGGPETRHRRLDAWEQEISEAEDHLAHRDRRRLRRLRSS